MHWFDFFHWYYIGNFLNYQDDLYTVAQALRNLHNFRHQNLANELVYNSFLVAVYVEYNMVAGVIDGWDAADDIRLYYRKCSHNYKHCWYYNKNYCSDTWKNVDGGYAGCLCCDGSGNIILDSVIWAPSDPVDGHRNDPF